MTFEQAIKYFNGILETGCVDIDEEFMDAVETAVRSLNVSQSLSMQTSSTASEFRSR